MNPSIDSVAGDEGEVSGHGHLRLDDYLHWHRLQVETGDLDPAYPVLRRIAREWGLDRDQLCWLIALHVAYYHLGSSLAAFSRTGGDPGGLPATRDELDASGLLSLPCATERRGHRAAGPLATHLLALRETHLRDAYGWYAASGWDWTRLNDQLTTVPGNGRWAAYKTAELIQKVAGAPLVAADAGHRYSSGPRKGLHDLFAGIPTGNSPDDIAELDRVTAQLSGELGEPDLAQVETSLCDFHSLIKGGYYLGHDIDAMLGQLLDRKVPTRTPHAAWVAREASFDVRLRGEANGWIGVRPDLKRLYRATGRLDWRSEEC